MNTYEMFFDNILHQSMNENKRVELHKMDYAGLEEAAAKENENVI